MEIRQQGVFESLKIKISKHRGYEFIFIFRKIPILINNYDFSSPILKNIFFWFWKSYDFFQTFSLFFLNSEFDFLSIQLDRFFLRFFFDFIRIIENIAVLIAALPLLTKRLHFFRWKSWIQDHLSSDSDIMRMLPNDHHQKK